MKLAALVLGSVIAALITSSCTPSGKSVSADKSVPQPSRPINSEVNQQPSPALKGEPYLSDDIEIVAVELEEKNARLGYELKISYPQIDIPRTPQERKFNSYVRKFIESEVKNFKRFCSKDRKDSGGRELRMDYHMGTSYEVLYATPEFLSINLTIVSFTGYLNSDWFPVPVNYDLKAGRSLENLADLFKPKANFLKPVAAYCFDKLMRRGVNCGGGGVGDEQWLRRGTAPKADNYSAWNLTRDGLQINYGEYQIGPGCLGLVSVVVPYDHLKGMLRQDVFSASLW